MLFRITAGLVALLPMVVSGQEVKQQMPLRVYCVGNSVTDTIDYRALAELAKSRGYKHIKEVFADGIHLNNVGSYVVGCTFFATLYRENPKGLPGEPYKVTDPKLAEVIQETVWKIVSTHELAGIAAGKANVADRSKSATVSRAGGYVVTVRVDHNSEVRVLQSKIGSDRD